MSLCLITYNYKIQNKLIADILNTFKIKHGSKNGHLIIMKTTQYSYEYNTTGTAALLLFNTIIQSHLSTLFCVTREKDFTIGNLQNHFVKQTTCICQLKVLFYLPFGRRKNNLKTLRKNKHQVCFNSTFI